MGVAKLIFVPKLEKAFKVKEEVTHEEVVTINELGEYTQIVKYALLTNAVKGHNVLVKQVRQLDEIEETLFDVFRGIEDGRFVMEKHLRSFIVLKKVPGSETEITVVKGENFATIEAYLAHEKNNGLAE